VNVLIICRVVDHFGDAGVCLRLARGLAARSNRVDLLIDRPELILAMCPSLRRGERVDGVRLMDWSDSAVAELCSDATPKSLLIETFHHEAPEPLRALFETLPGAARVMLDYLATEPWADSMECLRWIAITPVPIETGGRRVFQRAFFLVIRRN
jgi:hypothetical protein